MPDPSIDAQRTISDSESDSDYDLYFSVDDDNDDDDYCSRTKMCSECTQFFLLPTRTSQGSACS
jgi:hypothetical protein